MHVVQHVSLCCSGSFLLQLCTLPNLISYDVPWLHTPTVSHCNFTFPELWIVCWKHICVALVVTTHHVDLGAGI